VGDQMGCWRGGRWFGEAQTHVSYPYNTPNGGDPSYARGGFLSGMAFVFSDGTEQSVGVVDGSDGARVDAYTFAPGEALINYTVATTVNPATYQYYAPPPIASPFQPGSTSRDNDPSSAPWNQVACGVAIGTSTGKQFYFNGIPDANNDLVDNW